jgi:thioredoxin reductase (NADPH)
MEIKTILDAAIIGMGPAGISAAIYLKRGGIDPVCFEAKKIGGKINQIKEIENYPSFLGNGEELAKKLAEQMAYFKIGIKEEMVTNIYKLDDGTFQVKTRNADYLFRSVILASGIRERPFALKGSDLYQNNGISRCAECDGPFYKKKPVAVLGDSLAAIKDAGYLAGLCSKVYFISEGDKINVSTEELKEFTDLKIQSLFYLARCWILLELSIFKSLSLEIKKT